MNYEKLSRALRYYYDGDMISKVQGKRWARFKLKIYFFLTIQNLNFRFVYKFVCNLKELIGYDAEELSKLVREASLVKDTSHILKSMWNKLYFFKYFKIKIIFVISCILFSFLFWFHNIKFLSVDKN
jgi:hypothetical protein